MSATDMTEPTGGFRITGWHVLAGIGSFFAVVIAVDVTFTVLALKTFPGQVSATPYEDGLQYNREIARAEAQDRLGWRAAAEAAPGVVSVQFVDSAGVPVQGLTVTGRLERPATEAGKIAPKFAEVAPGRYAAPTGAIEGAWDLTAEAVDSQGRRFTAERRLTWP